MNVPFYDFSPVTKCLQEGLGEAFTRVLKSQHYILGYEVEAFEHEFAAYCGAAYCVGCSNGLDALHLILRAAEIGAGDEVIVPAHTFIATWLAVSAVGATIIGVDVEEDSCNISPQAVSAAITPRTRAIMAVHLYGRPADMHALRVIADRHQLLLIEDAAQAHGAAITGKRVGVLGDIAAFSFYPTKNLGALGDAGAVVSNNYQLIERVRSLANYGSQAKYTHTVRGYNARLDELQAALLRVKLPYLDTWNKERQAIAAQYDHLLARLPAIGLPSQAVHDEAVFQVWHLYVVQLRQRDVMQAALAAAGVQTLVHYPTPPHLQEAYAGYYAKGAFPVAERICHQALSLPLFPGLSAPMVDYVVAQIEQAVSRSG